MEKTFLQVLGLAGTVEILEYMKGNKTASYKELIQFVSVSTLNRRLNQLINFNLIVHHLDKKDRKEWYTLTEKGKTVLGILKQLKQVIEK